jgi:hypothetical protein
VDEDAWNDEDIDDEEDEEPAIACPYCRRSIYEDAEQCPYCGQYILDEDVTSGRKPWWIILGTLLALYAVYRWLGI